MSLWALLPASLSIGTISGAWIIYAMALYNHHVCPVNNWTYNSSCEERLAVQTGPFLCCTLDNIPLISKCGALPPESCWFSLICSIGSFMVMLIGLLRYAQVIHRQQNSPLNMLGLCTGWLCAAGLTVVGNFQVDFLKVLHYVGAGLAFPCSLLFVCVQTVLTYRLANTQRDFHTVHLRVALTLLALVTLVLSGVFFVQESFALQHAAALCEWLFVIVILLFYGSFVFEFRFISTDTLVVLIQKGAALHLCQNDCKLESA
ncbi:transmembrane protein 150A-like isoform X1 [Pygocentrus nattereri]|uniref:transmembrane protein 150A-like isoform X1 n=1 Tax=Pygocentrus nattereri TaxID=42514 RepID=UPI0008144BC9|nr:transmembrane protein 150A-like isoform X1 [Pygocentrus nattereri]